MNNVKNMCDIRLFRSARMDYETAVMIWKEKRNY